MFRRLLVLLCLVGASWGAPASPIERWSGWDDRLFQRLSTPNGEANDLGVMAMTQDRTGFLWVGTQQGLVRWDGYHLRAYTADRRQPNSLPDGYILSLRVDARDTLWIGTASHGLVRYRVATDDFEPAHDHPDGHAPVAVTALADAPDGQLWVGSEAGLDRYAPATGQWHRVAAAAQVGTVNAVLTDSAGRLWVGSSRGLFQARAEGDGLDAVPLPGLPAGSLRVARMLTDVRGRLWVAVDQHGLWVLDPEVGRWSVVAGTEPGPGGMRTESIRDLVDAGRGQIWAGTQARGLVLVDTETLQSRRIHRNPANSYGLDAEAIWALYRDRSDVLWVGTSRSLLRHNLQASFVHTVFGGEDVRAALRSEDIASVTQMSDGRLWIGVGTQGVDIVDPVRGVVQRLPADDRRPATALPNEWVTAVVPGPRDDVVIGTRRGLYRAALDGRWVRPLPVPGRPAVEDDQYLTPGWTGLWVGGADGLWRLRWDAAGAPRQDTPVQALSDRRVRALTRASSQPWLWVGTSRGVNLCHEETGEVRHLGGSPADPALARANVMALRVDRRGWLWVATGGTGLFVIKEPESAQPRVTHLGTADGLPKDFVNQVLEDTQGQIWVSTDQGLAQIDPATLRVRPLGIKDGVGIPIYWNGSGDRTTEGELVFGGQGGITIVRPQVLGWRDFQAPVIVTGVWIGGRPLSWGGAASPGPLVVPAGVDDLTVEFAALDFLAPGANRYAYRLVGHDDRWVGSDAASRQASYSNLSPGHYRLELRASNADGLWTDPPLLLPVEVRPAWHQTPLLRAFAGLAVLALIWGVMRLRTLWLLRRQHELEALVAQRTEELQQRTAELQASQARLAEMAYFDALTGLPNRRMLSEHFERLASAVRRDGQGGFALLMLDLDRFKQINDSLGHGAGDVLLQAAAQRLRHAVREVDTVARMGGDEFAILLSGLTEPATIEPVCRRIIQAFAVPVDYHGEAMVTSASIGVACYPLQGRTLDDLARPADRALYEAKDGGRNTWRFA